MNTTLKLMLLAVFLLASCAHNETTSTGGGRGIASEPNFGRASGQPQWENDVCILKGDSRESDYVVRFQDVHTMCPQLRDYNPAGTAYTKMKNNGRGVHIPMCQAPPADKRAPASRCWMGFDVFGESAGSCNLAKPQSVCSSCQCDGRTGVAWQ